MNEPDIDYTKISFPSDRLTLGVLREYFPGQFDGEYVTLMNSPGGQNAGELLENLLGSERYYAGAVLAMAIGVKFDPVVREEVDHCKETLLELYQQLHLATGPFQAIELVRRIETQSRAQAINLTPPGS